MRILTAIGVGLFIGSCIAVAGLLMLQASGVAG